ncbi:MAG: hypothetical protein LUF86_06750, partial [Clostridiales bacterium]|nr:hypothetical protein [Clostridiales bacterium]
MKKLISLALVLSMTVSMVMTCAMADGTSVTVPVGTAAELQTALQSTEYSGYDKVVVQLTADITLTADTLITSLGSSDVTIDGQSRYTLSAPSGDAGSYTLFTLSSPNGKTLTFENLTIDAGNQQLLSVTNGTNTALAFSGATLTNLYGASNNSGGIAFVGKGSGNDITCDVTFTNTAVSGVGTLLTVRYANLTASGSSFTASALEGGAAIYLRNNAGEYYQCTADLEDCDISWTDSTGGLSYGIYTGTYWTLTLDGGSAVTGAETYAGSDGIYAAVYAGATSSELILNDCTVSNTDGTAAVIA